MKCHGCLGKGWIEISGSTSICPICKGKGIALSEFRQSEQEDKYDQSAIWTKLREEHNVNVSEKISKEVDKVPHDRKPVSILLHLLFNRSVVPQGNVFIHHLQSKHPLSQNELISRGYLLDGNGKIRTNNNIPIGIGYELINDWASVWINKKKVSSVIVDLNRKGDPEFIDGNMMCFTIVCNDRESLKEMLLGLQTAAKLRKIEIVNLMIHLLA